MESVTIVFHLDVLAKGCEWLAQLIELLTMLATGQKVVFDDTVGDFFIARPR